MVVFYRNVAPPACFQSQITRQLSEFELFEVGKSYSKANIKTILSDLYKDLDYKATAKASDLEGYFDIKRCFMPEGDKRVNGFKILGKK